MDNDTAEIHKKSAPDALDSDPELEAEEKYAKDHAIESTNLPIRERLKLVREAKGVAG